MRKQKRNHPAAFLPFRTPSLYFPLPRGRAPAYKYYNVVYFIHALFFKKKRDMFWQFAELLYLCTRKRETRALARGSESLGSTVL